MASEDGRMAEWLDCVVRCFGELTGKDISMTLPSALHFLHCASSCLYQSCRELQCAFVKLGLHAARWLGQGKKRRASAGRSRSCLHVEPTDCR
eukprot:3994957-Amphidinium_carterae.1